MSYAFSTSEIMEKMKYYKIIKYIKNNYNAMKKN